MEVFQKRLNLMLGDVFWKFRDYSGSAGLPFGLDDPKFFSGIDTMSITVLSGLLKSSVNGVCT